MEMIGQRSEMMWVVCDEILLVWKINSEKYGGNQDKCAGLEMKDKELLVVVLMVPVIAKAMLNKNLLKLLDCLGKQASGIKAQVVEVKMVLEKCRC